MLDLTAIKLRQSNRKIKLANFGEQPLTPVTMTDIDALLLEVERLRTENEKLGEALREYNDAELYYAHKDRN